MKSARQWPISRPVFLGRDRIDREHVRYTSAMFPILTQSLAWLSRVCGFETLDSFPAGHPYARTRWNAAYFDIASDLKPEQIERSICDRIENTPIIFAHIDNPTPRMQRMLLSVIEARMRHTGGAPLSLVAMLATPIAARTRWM